METPVDKEESKAIAERYLEAARFARRLPYIQKYLTLGLRKWEREDIGLVILLSVLAVYSLCEIIAADDEREFETAP